MTATVLKFERPPIDTAMGSLEAAQTSLRLARTHSCPVTRAALLDEALADILNAAIAIKSMLGGSRA